MNALKQRQILNALQPNFAREGQTDFLEQAAAQIRSFIAQYVASAHAGGAVIGMSGGIDSFLVGALLAQVCRERSWRLVAVILPNGQQSDIVDAEACCERLKEIYPGAETPVLNINSAYTACSEALSMIPGFKPDVYALGNLQPRLRMLYQYALAQGLLVAGTDHCAEAITGFYTKYGDGGTDFNPIGQLLKDDIFAMAAALGAPPAVLDKPPAAGLGISADDESELKLTYKDICAFLRGCPVPDEVEKRLIGFYDRSAHKRAVPPTPAWLFRTERVVTHVHVCGGDAAAAGIIQYMNRHPNDVVLYVGEPQAAFAAKLHKTINTPISRYNCFRGWEPENPVYGPLTENVSAYVKISGECAGAQRLEQLLSERGLQVRVLNPDFT